MFDRLKIIASRVWAAATSTTASPSQWLLDWAGARSSDSGVQVDPVSAMRYAPIWYAVNRIAGHTGIMPLVLLEELEPRQKNPAKRHPAYSLLKRRPNRLMNPSVFKELIQHHALLWGNGRAFIDRNGRGEPSELIPLPPETKSILVNGEKFHYYRDRDTNREIVLEDKHVLHILGLGFDGIQGYSLVEFAKNSIGLGMAAEKHMNRHFRNNAVPSLVLEAPPGTFRKEEDAKQFLANWERHHQGLDDNQKTGLLREGIKANVLSMPGKDAQWLDQRKFQRQEAALWMMLESILGDDDSVSYNSLEQKNQAYLSNGLRRWLTKWEEECNTKLLTFAQQNNDTHFFKFRTNALLSVTAKDRHQVYQIGRQLEMYSANDCRDFEDLNAIEGGDVYANPAITPGGSEPDEPEPDSTDDDSGEDMAENISRRQIEAMLEIEAGRVLDAARQPSKNFIKWVDRFYTRDWQPALAVMYLGIGASKDDVLKHVEDSKESILEAAGRASSETLVAEVQSVLETWPSRAKEWGK